MITLTQVSKVFEGKRTAKALENVSLQVERGELVAIVGPSGSGKSTLLNLIGGLDRPTQGSVWLAGEELSALGERARGLLRNRELGFVYQFHHLLPEFTAFENVEMPLLFKGAGARERRERVEWLFEQVGLADRMRHKPTELSGGQMQRVAIARALACEPALVLADEPTGNLDTTSGQDIMGLFQDLAEKGHTLVLITHDAALARRTQRIVRIQDGRIVADGPASAAA